MESPFYTYIQSINKKALSYHNLGLLHSKVFINTS